MGGFVCLLSVMRLSKSSSASSSSSSYSSSSSSVAAAAGVIFDFCAGCVTVVKRGVKGDGDVVIVWEC